MIDKAVMDTIKEVTRTSGQPDPLADAIESWLSAIARGEETPSDPRESERRLERIYSFVDVSIHSDEQE